MPQHIPYLLLLLILNSLVGCATLDGPKEAYDPWERFNRSMFTFNEKVDAVVLKPMAKGYRSIMPKPVEAGVSNFFFNLDEISVIANDMLQFKLLELVSDSGRFIVNSSIGIGGVFDVAKHMGLKKRYEDFGQTLGYWGANNGPYLVLPFFGPSSVRDSLGRIGDYQIQPVAEVDDRSDRIILYTLDIVSKRAELLEAGEILDEAAFDQYIFLREAYLQRRKSLVYDGRIPVESTTDEEEIDIFSDE